MNGETSTGKHNLLLVEDDLELATLIGNFLAKYEFNVTTCDNGLEAEQYVREMTPDIVVLDIMLPGQNGMDICKNVRPQYTGLILMQSALSEDIDQMMGLELGADDYIVKQIQPRMLLSRIRALLRRNDVYSKASLRSSEHNNHAIGTSELNIDPRKRSVKLNDVSIDLTASEFELLFMLANSMGKIVSREDIVQQVRGFEYDGLDRSIDRRISRLRKKLADDSSNPTLIKTIRGKGYQLCL